MSEEPMDLWRKDVQRFACAMHVWAGLVEESQRCSNQAMVYALFAAACVATIKEADGFGVPRLFITIALVLAWFAGRRLSQSLLAVRRARAIKRTAVPDIYWFDRERQERQRKHISDTINAACDAIHRATNINTVVVNGPCREID